MDNKEGNYYKSGKGKGCILRYFLIIAHMEKKVHTSNNGNEIIMTE